MVLWNQDKIKAEGTFKAQYDLESLFWHHSANQFVSAHERGMFSIWTVPESEDGEMIQESYTPYGPFPCKPIRKVEWQDPYVVFSGGLPRASYGDKHSVSLLQGNSVQVVFEFTSKVLDFFIIPDHVNQRRFIFINNFSFYTLHSDCYILFFSYLYFTGNFVFMSILLKLIVHIYSLIHIKLCNI